tara:strand:- start:90 stop:260 length:171 start_codon:yes stop_codon:yes gene_type:complete
LDGRDDLEEITADAHERVLKTKCTDAWIDKAGIDTQNVSQVVDYGIEFSRDKTNLA